MCWNVEFDFYPVDDAHPEDVGWEQAGKGHLVTCLYAHWGKLAQITTGHECRTAKDVDPTKKSTTVLDALVSTELDVLFKQSSSLENVLQLAAFDNWQGDQKKVSLWCLVASQRMYSLSLSSPDSQLWCGTGDNYHFTSEDELTNKITRYENDEEFKYRLTQFIFSKKPDCQRYDLGFRELQMINNSYEPTGNKWAFTLDVKDIIIDESLKTEELPKSWTCFLYTWHFLIDRPRWNMIRMIPFFERSEKVVDC